MAAEDKIEQDALDLFRKDVGTFVRMYDFLSQIFDYGDTGLEKRSLYLRLLLPRLTGRVTKDPIDFSTVELTHIKQTRSGDHALDLDAGTASAMDPPGSGGTGQTRDPKLARLAEILGRINELFADEDFTSSGVESWAQGVVTVLVDDDRIRAQAAANSQTQFLESPDLSDAVTGAVLSNQDTNNRLVDHLFAREDRRAELIRLLGRLAYEELSSGTV